MRRDTKPYDSAFKDLAEQDPEALLLLLEALPPGATVKLLPREVSVQALLPDQPYEITRGEEKQLVHVEAETRYKAEVPTRVADYMVYLWVRYRLPVSSYVLVLTPSGMPDEVPTSLAIEAGGLRLIVSYRVVRLWEIKAREALALGRESLLPFVP
jgi:predicted transposase YdaD